MEENIIRTIDRNVLHMKDLFKKTDNQLLEDRLTKELEAFGQRNDNEINDLMTNYAYAIIAIEEFDIIENCDIPLLEDRLFLSEEYKIKERAMLRDDDDDFNFFSDSDLKDALDSLGINSDDDILDESQKEMLYAAFYKLVTSKAEKDVSERISISKDDRARNSVGLIIWGEIANILINKYYQKEYEDWDTMIIEVQNLACCYYKRNFLPQLFYLYKKTHTADVIYYEVNKILMIDINKRPFEEHIQSSKYGKYIYDVYKEYVEKHPGCECLLSEDLFIEKEPTIDQEKGHQKEGWFVTVDQNKFKWQGIKGKLKGLNSLHRKLIENGLLSKDTPINLFIYRFSGILPLSLPDVKMEWTGSKTKLAILINLLTAIDGGQSKYKTVGQFFNEEKFNGSSFYKNACSDDIKSVEGILIECGFEVPNKSKSSTSL